MIEYVLLVALAAGVELTGLGRASLPALQRRRHLGAVVAALSLALVALFALQLRIERLAAALQTGQPAWFDRLPQPVLTLVGPLHLGPARGPSLALEFLAVVESLTLFVLFIVLERGGTTRRAAPTVALATLAMLGLAVAPHALTSADVYAYAGYAKLGLAAYAPPAHAFAGAFAPLARIYGNRLDPSPYGPLWLLAAHAALVPAGEPAAALRVFEIGGAFAFLLLIALLRQCGIRGATLALVALNPMLIEQFVADAHNDIWALDALALAFALRATRPGFAAALVAGAGLVKLPFLALGALVFARGGSVRERIVLIGGATLSCAAVSLVLGGTAYPLGLLTHAARERPQIGWELVRVAFTLVALAAIVVRFRGASIPGAIWTFPMLSSNLYPWYLSWGLPYGVTGTRALVPWLCALPFAAFAIDPTFVRFKIASALALVLAIVAVVAARRLRSGDGEVGAGRLAPNPRADARVL